MINVRVKFTKKGPMKYVGHLDMMRYFQKAIRRSGLDICYSEGFSPHQIMSFASPLGVGMESDAEYFDAQFHNLPDLEEAVDRLNEQMAEGVVVTSMSILPEKAKKAMTSTAATDWEISFRPGHELPCGWDNMEKKLSDFMGQAEINMLKKTKKSEKIVDIKPMIYQLEYRDDPEKGQLIFMKLCTLSGKTLGCRLLMEAFYQFCGVDYDEMALMINRAEVYMDLAESEEEHDFLALCLEGK